MESVTKMYHHINFCLNVVCSLTKLNMQKILPLKAIIEAMQKNWCNWNLNLAITATKMQKRKTNKKSKPKKTTMDVKIYDGLNFLI